MINFNEIQKELHENELARRKLDHERRRKEQEYADIRKSLLAKVRALQADMRREEAEATQRMEALLAKADRQRQEHNKLQLRTERLLARQRRHKAKSAAKAATDSFISLYDKIFQPATASDADVRWRGFDQPYRGPAAMTDAAANSYGGLFATRLSGGGAGGSNLLFETPPSAYRLGGVFDATRGPVGDTFQTPTIDASLRFSADAGHSRYAFDKHSIHGGASEGYGARSHGWIHEDGNTASTGSQLHRDETNSSTLNLTNIPSSSGSRVPFGDGIPHQNANRRSESDNDIGLRLDRDASGEPSQAPNIVTSTEEYRRLSNFTNEGYVIARGHTMGAREISLSTGTQDGPQSRTGVQPGHSLSAHGHQISMERGNPIIRSQDQFVGQHVRDEVNVVTREIDSLNKPKPGNRTNNQGMGMSGNISDNESSLESESKHFPETRKQSHTTTPSAKSSQQAQIAAPSVKAGGNRQLKDSSQPNQSPSRAAVVGGETVPDGVTPQTSGADTTNTPAPTQRQSTAVKINTQQKEPPPAEAQSRQPPTKSDQAKNEPPKAAGRNTTPAVKSSTQEKQGAKKDALSSQASTSKGEPSRATVTTKDDKQPQPAKETLSSATAGSVKTTAPSPEKEKFKFQSDSDDDFVSSSKAGGLSFSALGGGDRPPLTHTRSSLERSASISSVDSVEAMIQAAQTVDDEAAGLGKSSGDHPKAAKKDDAGNHASKPSTDAAAALVKTSKLQSTAGAGPNKPQPPTAAPRKSGAAESAPAAPTTQSTAPRAKSTAPSAGSAMYSGRLARSSALADEDTNSDSAGDLSAGREGDDDEDDDFFG